MGGPGVAKFAEAIGKNDSLQKLYIKGNNIGGVGCMKLAERLANKERLEDLDLNGNNIGDMGAAKLAEVLVHLPKLAKIDLGENNIGPKGLNSLILAWEQQVVVPQVIGLPGFHVGVKTAKMARHATMVVDEKGRELVRKGTAVFAAETSGANAAAQASGANAAAQATDHRDSDDEGSIPALRESEGSARGKPADNQV
eukprot:gnl/TRDRNA2_/TRDRNA2_157179_c2_seq1.p1 gnl/TRDRNA2_/TRDRNA2_157179_c2~~gnl/TRDRNA2_/TRDRNA2_157179_c2_seq1.p1  ORF type:complete len:210 (-),score=58.92 gnl/TRDRNA2_/TRDRNA2_157179_c2_seq1:126-719(-)